MLLDEIYKEADAYLKDNREMTRNEVNSFMTKLKAAISEQRKITKE